MTEVPAPTPSRCPYCGKNVASLFNPASVRPPRKGDVTVCVACGGICILDKDMHVCKATREQLMNLCEEARRELFLTSKVIQAAKNERRAQRN